MLRIIAICAVAFAALNACTPAERKAEGPPVAKTVDVSDTFFGETVADPYRWLEDWSDPAVKEWSSKQSAYTRNYLDALPERPAVHKRVEELITGGEPVAYQELSARATGLFAVKYDPKVQQPYLVLMPSADQPDAARTLVDPNAIDAAGGVVLDWYRASHDGKTVAVSLSKGGSEAGDIHLFDVATGKESGEVIARVQGGTAGGDLAWLPDDKGFYYTRYPREGERAGADMDFFQQVYVHRIGEDPAKDQYVLGKEFPRIAEVRLFVEKTGRLLITVQDGDSSRFANWLRETDGKIAQVAKFEDKLADLAFGPDGRLFGISWKNDPRGEIIALPAKAPTAAAAKTIIAPSDGAVGTGFYDLFSPTVSIIGDKLFVIYQVGGPSELRVFGLDGKRLKGPDQPPISSVSSVTDAGAAGILFSETSYVAYNTWSAFDLKSGATKPLAISSPQTVDYSDVEVVREEATSKDGAKIPITILMPKGAKPDGTRAIVVTGYGGYGVSITPGFSRSRHILPENGVIFAEANLRGGGEFGEAWHRAGALTSKQNVFDDFIAVVEHLVAKGYAAKDRVGITGGSNGGLLMGAVLTQRPDLASVVVSHVGIYDSLRSELGSNGAFNIPEFGTVKDEAQYHALRAYSPYHNVKPKTRYPAILLPTGANDPRVDPMHSRKFAAALQATQAGDAPILLRAEEGSGHGSSSTNQTVELNTDQYAFIFHMLKVPVKAD